MKVKFKTLILVLPAVATGKTEISVLNFTLDIVFISFVAFSL